MDSDSVEKLIANCKRNNSLLWMAIRDLSEDYRRLQDVDNTVKKLKKISDTLDALASVVAK